MALLQKSSRIFSLAIICIVVTAMVSCGGGQIRDEDKNPGPPNPSGSNRKPVAIISTSPDTAVPDESFYLDGSKSYDPDKDDTVDSFKWSQTAGTDITLINTDEKKTSFTVPNETTTLTFKLVVTDSNGASSDPATVNVNVTASTPPPPPPPPPKMTAVFVSATLGKDENDGSAKKPVATIARGLAIAASKKISTVYVMEGTYGEFIVLPSKVDLRGNVVSINKKGNPVFGEAGSDKTVIAAPFGHAVAVQAKDISDVEISGFKIIGAENQNSASAMLIENSSSIDVLSNIFTTPGKANGQCRDLEIKTSDDIIISANKFANAGVCDDYIAISVEDSSSIKIDASEDVNQFTFKSSGEEKYLKAIQSIGGDEIEISQAQIEDDGTPLKDDMVFTGIVLNDAEQATIKDNTIDVGGALDATGISLRCEAAAVDINVEHNKIVFGDTATKQTGVRITCPQDDSNFVVQRNTMSFMPPIRTAAEMQGIDATSFLSSISLRAVNNIILMDAALIDDAADKTAIYLNSIGSTSTVELFYNTLFITGNMGELHAVYSNQGNLKFNATGNIFLIYGSNGNNASFSLPKACEANFCANDVVTNLFNSKFYRNDVKFIYYYDTMEASDFSVANECDGTPLPIQCSKGDVDRRGNVVDTTLKPSFFDFADGGLLETHQGLAKDNGEPLEDITIDINENERDSTPDIGAIEY